MIQTRDAWPTVAARIRGRAGGRCEHTTDGRRCDNADRPATPLTVHTVNPGHQGRATDADLLALCPTQRNAHIGPTELARIARAFGGTTADSAPVPLFDELT